MSLSLKSVGIAGLLAWSAVDPSQSPASIYFNHVRDALLSDYVPRAGVDVAGLLRSADRELDARCQDFGSTCPEDVGAEVAARAVAGLGDPHTRIETPPRTARTQAGPAAPSAPLGWMVRATRDGAHRYVSWVAPDGPAAAAGVRRHDRIVGLDSLTAADLTSRDAPLSLTFSRLGTSHTVEIRPGADQGPMPRLDWIERVAVLQFPLGAGDGVAQRAHDLVREARRGNAEAMILDLRDNPGGGLQCAAMAGAFLDYRATFHDRAGIRNVLTVRSDRATMADGDETERLDVDRPERWDGPLAVLVNENTGSCAEAVAIQASLASRALIVGQSSVGVGNNIIQPVPLPGGRRLLMTVAYARDDQGRDLPAVPRIDVEIDDDPVAVAHSAKDQTLTAALAALQAKSPL